MTNASIDLTRPTHQDLHAAAQMLLDADYLTEIEDVLYFLENPRKWEPEIQAWVHAGQPGPDDPGWTFLLRRLDHHDATPEDSYRRGRQGGGVGDDARYRCLSVGALTASTTSSSIASHASTTQSPTRSACPLSSPAAPWCNASARRSARRRTRASSEPTYTRSASSTPTIR